MNITKLKTCVTSSYVKDKDLTEKHLDFLDDLVRAQQNFNRALPYDPMQRNESDRRFMLNLRTREVFDQFLEIKNKLNGLAGGIDYLRSQLRKESGQNELQYLEEITDCFSREFRITTDIENNYYGVSFNISFAPKDFYFLKLIPDLIATYKVRTKQDIEIVHRALNHNETQSGNLYDLSLDTIYLNARKEINDLNKELAPLNARGFSAELILQSVSSRNVIFKFSLSRK